jgi:hypothetical protein
MYSCYYATRAIRNIRCLITAGKYVNSTRDIARQLLGKQVPAATNTHIIMEIVFSTRSVPICYNRDKSLHSGLTRVEAGSNTSTVTLRVIGGDKKGSLKFETVK